MHTLHPLLPISVVVEVYPPAPCAETEGFPRNQFLFGQEFLLLLSVRVGGHEGKGQTAKRGLPCTWHGDVQCAPKGAGGY